MHFASASMSSSNSWFCQAGARRNTHSTRTICFIRCYRYTVVNFEIFHCFTKSKWARTVQAFRKHLTAGPQIGRFAAVFYIAATMLVLFSLHHGALQNNKRIHRVWNHAKLLFNGYVCRGHINLLCIVPEGPKTMASMAMFSWVSEHLCSKYPLQAFNFSNAPPTYKTCGGGAFSLSLLRASFTKIRSNLLLLSQPLLACTSDVRSIRASQFPNHKTKSKQGS